MYKSVYVQYLESMLALVPDTVDKREGSIIYDALAPVAAFLAEQLYMFSYLQNLLFADTSEWEWLDRVVNDFGVNREEATKAIREIDITDGDGDPMQVDPGVRFAIEDVKFAITENIETGRYKAECETAGTIGNRYSGALLPVDNLNGLGSAVLVQAPLIPARDQETDEELRARFYKTVRQSPFGGNIADYERETLAIDGVGAVKVFNATTMGAGHVGLVIGDEQENAASQELIDTVQELYGTNGDGLSPIFHTVHVKTGADLSVDVTAEIKLKPGASFAIVKPYVEAAIQEYINGIGFSEETVYYAKLMSEILSCHESIVDVTSMTIGGGTSNMAIDKEYETFELPVVGTVTVTEAVSG